MFQPLSTNPVSSNVSNTAKCFVAMFQVKVLSFSFFLSLKGWAWLSFRRHHICFGWHGSRRILLCECHCNNCSLVLAVTFAHKFTFNLNFRGICTGGEVWFHQTFCSHYPGIKRKCPTRVFATDANSQAQWEISSFYFKIVKWTLHVSFFYIVRHCTCFRLQISEVLCR